MAIIRFKKWNIGMKPISFVELLHYKAGIRLKEAKEIKDRIVNDNEVVDIQIQDLELAKTIREESILLGVDTDILL